MQSIARERGMEVLWENVSWCALRLPEDVEEVKALIPNIRFTLDIKQAFRAGLPWETMMDAMGREIAHVHLLDIRPDGGVCLPGEGTVDFGRLFRRLNKLRYQGDVILCYGNQEPGGAGALHRLSSSGDGAWGIKRHSPSVSYHVPACRMNINTIHRRINQNA